MLKSIKLKDDFYLQIKANKCGLRSFFEKKNECQINKKITKLPKQNKQKERRKTQ